MKSYYMENTDRGIRVTMDEDGYNGYGDTGIHEEVIGIGCVAMMILFLIVIW